MRLRRAAAILIRVLAAVILLQLSGLGHVLDDLANHVFAATTLDAHHADCDDEPVNDCPPGAAGCHHSHANVIPGQPLAELLAGLRWATSGPRVAITSDETRPRSRGLAVLERPPRRTIA